MIRSLLRMAAIAASLLAAWQLLATATGVPHYILPNPGRVAAVLVSERSLLAGNAAVTFTEIGLGLLLGAFAGAVAAVLLAASAILRRWLLPVLVVSQAIPVFALAPLLVLWLGYGMASKVAMATLIIFFPVTAAFYDGLRRTDAEWLSLARTMGASQRAVLRHIALPAALPAFTSGLRVATAVAPIGAVVGEWVGSSAGLGYLMLNANARMQTDLMFAALLVLSCGALVLYFSVDGLCHRLLPWVAER